MATYVAKQAVRNGSLIAVNKRRTDGELVPYLKEASTGRYREAIRDNLLTVDNPAIKDLISIIEQIDFEPMGGDFGQIDPGDLQGALDDFSNIIGEGFEDIGLLAGVAIITIMGTLGISWGIALVTATAVATAASNAEKVRKDKEKKKDNDQIIGIPRDPIEILNTVLNQYNQT